MKTELEVQKNNIDLIRLLAAMQVVVLHLIEHFEIDLPIPLIKTLQQFPGVPVFFFLSGFLIFESYSRSPSNWNYAINRFLRLYPGLTVCFVGSVALVFASDYFDNNALGIWEFAIWSLGQLTIIQFYNPDFLRGFGTGVLNGSLWTIAVEVQFYLLVPLLYHYSKDEKNRGKVLLALIVLFTASNQLILNVLPQFGSESIGLKLLSVTFVPWFYMFLVGAWLSINKSIIPTLVRIRWPLLIGYLLLRIAANHFGFPEGNKVDPLSFLLMSTCVVAWAYSNPGLSNRLLKKNDISYGVYIYHMPLVNFALYSYAQPGTFGAFSVFLATILLASASWFFVERPSLRLKKRAHMSR